MKNVIGLLFIFLLSQTSFGQPPSSDVILNTAYKQAKKEKKNVIVIFHASWCGWCKKMDASMQDVSTKNYFDNNYVTVHLTVQESKDHKMDENPGADAFLAKYNGETAGLPFFLVLDKDGKKLADSFGKDGNLGCPASESEVAEFISIVKKTSKIDETGLSAITKRFRQNEAPARIQR